MPSITYRGSPADFRAEVDRLMRCLAGEAADPRVDEIKRRMAEVLLGKIHEAYQLKKVGGTDDLGVQWPELSPVTVRRKGHATIMVEEGDTLESLRPASGHPNQILRLGPGWLEVGSDRSTPGGIPIISLHSRSHGRTPARPILPADGVELPASWVEAMGQVLLEALTQQQFWREFLGGMAA
jgi:hypothetical protein